jgi:hypothetical protein
VRRLNDKAAERYRINLPRFALARSAQLKSSVSLPEESCAVGPGLNELRRPAPVFRTAIRRGFMIA